MHRVSLAGRLRFSNGRPAAYLFVRAGRQRTQTDADGLYYFLDLPPGDHPVIAEVPGRGELEIRTQDGSGVVPLPEESPVEGATSHEKEDRDA
jgi:hypothetical protein